MIALDCNEMFEMWNVCAKILLMKNKIYKLQMRTKRKKRSVAFLCLST